MPTRIALVLTVLTVLVLVALVDGTPSPTAEAQTSEGPPIWDSPKNLQVLPEDISSQELRGYMVGAAQGLGVRCWFCHIGEEGQDLTTFDFVSDEKKHKQVAREMFRMMLNINAETMAKVAEIEGDEEAARVRCVTCHRGKTTPTLE